MPGVQRWARADRAVRVPLLPLPRRSLQYSPRSLEAGQRAAAEAKLWAAAAALEEHAAMARHLSRRSDEEVDEGLAADYQRVAEQSRTAARLLVEELHQRGDAERP